MKFLKTLAVFSAISVVAASCTKEQSFSANGSGGSGSGSIQGNWKLVSTSGTTSTSTTENTSGTITKAEIILRYTSRNPVGVYNISSSVFKGIGVGYDYDGKLIIRQLENNVVQFEDSSDINMPVPPTNSESKYKLVGADSIYFETGAISGPSAPGSTTPTVTGVGCKYKLAGNRLTFIMKTSIPQVITQNGITLNVIQSTDVNIVLEKQ